MALATGSSVSALTRTLSSAGRIAGSASRRTGRRIRRAAIAAPLDTGGFLGASITGWISTSPSLLPRTWWMWTLNIGLSQTYGYTAGVLIERLLLRGMRVLGLSLDIAAERRRLARLAGGAALVGISDYSWVRGVLRQREISHLVQQEPKNLATHVVGTAGGVAASFGALIAARSVIVTAQMYRALLRPYLPRRLVGAVSLVLTIATVTVVIERVVRGRVLEQMIERAEAANRLIAPDVPRPLTPLRSGSPDS